MTEAKFGASLNSASTTTMWARKLLKTMLPVPDGFQYNFFLGQQKVKDWIPYNTWLGTYTSAHQACLL